jgi:hypothetical protein
MPAKESEVANQVWTLEEIAVLILVGMGYQGKKRSLSPHQKQMRFFAVALIVVVIVVTILIFWFLGSSI